MFYFPELKTCLNIYTYTKYNYPESLKLDIDKIQYDISILSKYKQLHFTKIESLLVQYGIDINNLKILLDTAGGLTLEKNLNLKDIKLLIPNFLNYLSPIFSKIDKNVYLQDKQTAYLLANLYLNFEERIFPNQIFKEEIIKEFTNNRKRGNFPFTSLYILLEKENQKEFYHYLSILKYKFYIYERKNTYYDYTILTFDNKPTFHSPLSYLFLINFFEELFDLSSLLTLADKKGIYKILYIYYLPDFLRKLNNPYENYKKIFNFIYTSLRVKKIVKNIFNRDRTFRFPKKFENIRKLKNLLEGWEYFWVSNLYDFIFHTLYKTYTLKELLKYLLHIGFIYPIPVGIILIKENKKLKLFIENLKNHFFYQYIDFEIKELKNL